MVSVGISILSWQGAETLKASLESYRRENLFSIFDEAQVFLPDPDDDTLSVAKAFDINVRTIPQNLGILENMAASAAVMETDYILMLENDCPLIESEIEARKQISSSLKMLQRSNVVMARLRSVRSPGQEFTGLAKYRCLFDGSLKSRVERALRPDKIRRLAGYALYDTPDTISRHTTYFDALGGGYYLVDATIMPWTNQSILINRDRFLNEIIPLAKSVKTNRHANKLPNLEIELNKTPLWKNSGWKIACTPGLFTHERIGHRGYD